jgi:2-dehydro-3-deoxygluconokinase
VVSQAGFEVDVVDPIGAGDAFVAGFLGGILRKMAPSEFLALAADVRRPFLEESLQIANVCGALTCTRLGDTAAMPTMKEAGEFLSGRS